MSRYYEREPDDCDVYDNCVPIGVSDDSGFIGSVVLVAIITFFCVKYIFGVMKKLAIAGMWKPFTLISLSSTLVYWGWWTILFSAFERNALDVLWFVVLFFSVMTVAAALVLILDD